MATILSQEQLNMLTYLFRNYTLNNWRISGHKYFDPEIGRRDIIPVTKQDCP
jgi:hypothetical protein